MSRYPEGLGKAWYVTLNPEHRERLGHMKRHGLTLQVQVNNDPHSPLGEHLVVELMNGDQLVTTHLGHELEQLFEDAYKSALPFLPSITSSPEQ
ncbi:hypothetical protein ACFFLM_08920 [Deinococcus oregonensis]|uniref:Uncharacterized protein n=1 Tax=Deinococcus oregonensis TaxID=1805970 RepID=A0ABV6AZM0_9DEIO